MGSVFHKIIEFSPVAEWCAYDIPTALSDELTCLYVSREPLASRYPSRSLERSKHLLGHKHLHISLAYLISHNQHIYNLEC